MDPWRSGREMQAKWAIRAIVPVLYLGGLLIYFIHEGGSIDGAISIGLGPTLLGLAVVCLLFSIPLIVAIFRIARGTRAAGSDERGGPTGPHDGGDGFDADAVIARYLAQTSAKAAAGSPGSSPLHAGDTAKRTGFGRRSR
jgi:hypothetical protein